MSSKACFGGVIVSFEANYVARLLIQEFHIQKQHNLAFLLNINKCFDDHQVLRLWLQKLIDEHFIDVDDLAIQARIRLSNLV